MPCQQLLLPSSFSPPRYLYVLLDSCLSICATDFCGVPFAHSLSVGLCTLSSILQGRQAPDQVSNATTTTTKKGLSVFLVVGDRQNSLMRETHVEDRGERPSHSIGGR